MERSSSVSTKENQIIRMRDSSSSNYPEVPEEFRCPLLNGITVEPVVLFCGHTFEKRYVEEHMKHSRNCLINNQVLSHRMMAPNRCLRSLIRNWVRGKGSRLGGAALAESVALSAHKYHEMIQPAAHEDQEMTQPAVHEGQEMIQPAAHEGQEMIHPAVHEEMIQPAAHEELIQPPAHDENPPPAHEEMIQPPAHDGICLQPTRIRR
ncbi:hypothetical protein YC2023_000806 [Brassica napus]